MVHTAGSCPNFEVSRKIVTAEIAAALAAGARLIELSQDKFAIVDPEDYDRLSEYKWWAVKEGRTYYASTHIERKYIKMHRLILNAPPHLFVDHINHNGLNNRRANLRLCTVAQNSRNRRPHRGASSKYKGVSWSKRAKKFIATIYADGKRYNLGYFKNEIEAAKAYDRKAAELFGEFAYLNFPEDRS